MEVETLSPLLAFKNGSVVTNSRDVAAFFEKRHDNVIRDIRNIVEQAPESVLNFEEFKINDLTGTSASHFDMTRDGFTLLAMGFTGSKALKFKIAYINQFNAMEAELRSREEDEVAPSPEAESRLLVGEARRTFGVKAAQQLWAIWVCRSCRRCRWALRSVECAEMTKEAALLAPPFHVIRCRTLRGWCRSGLRLGRLQE